jgi:hypothetical protein
VTPVETPSSFNSSAGSPINPGAGSTPQNKGMKP